jgi:hypothetical protein
VIGEVQFKEADTLMEISGMVGCRRLEGGGFHSLRKVCRAPLRGTDVEHDAVWQ